MKFLTLILLVITSVNNLFAQSGNFRVITYNIWNGYDFGKDEPRRGRVNEWIKEQEPTIVALQELCEYTPDKLANDAKTWGHQHSALLKTTGYSVGLTSAYPIVIKEKIMSGMHHGALHCQTNGIDIFVVHLSPMSYLKRRKEASIILEKLTEVRKKNDRYVVLGDFNAHSPMDADLYNPNGALISRLRESNKDNPVEGNLFNGNLDYAVISAFLSFPLIDVCQPFTNGLDERGSFPGQVLGEINHETKEALISRNERIDYVLVSPELSTKCTAAKVCNGEENYFLSDHYPVIATFKF
jgi:endonuclease/exonuclease/phosphatase family metal-dependent hydrolase